MSIVINGSGTITGISAGGLPDGSVTADDLASTLDLSGKTVTLAAGGTGYGKVLQVVSATDTGDIGTSSASWSSTGLYATITPTSATSKILCIASSNCSHVSVSGNALNSSFYRGTSGEGSGSMVGANRYYWKTGAAGLYQPSQMMHLDSPASTSALTYTVMQASSTSGSLVGWFYGFAAGNLATLVLMEIAA